MKRMGSSSARETQRAFPLSELAVLECGICKIINLVFRQLLAVYSVREGLDEMLMRLGLDLRDVKIELEYGSEQLIVALESQHYEGLLAGMSGVSLSCCSGMPV